MLLNATISPPTCVTTLQLDLCNGAATRLKQEQMNYPITTVCLRANSETLADFLQKVSAFFPARHSLLRFSSAFICETEWETIGPPQLRKRSSKDCYFEQDSEGSPKISEIATGSETVEKVMCSACCQWNTSNLLHFAFGRVPRFSLFFA